MINECLLQEHNISMEEHFIIYYCVLWLISATARVTHSQIINREENVGSCAPLEASDLGSMSMLSTSGIVAESFITGNGSDPPLVQILRHHLVCEVTGFLKNTVGVISMLVEYDCRGLFCPGANGSLNTTVTATSQFQFQCDPDTSTFRGIASNNTGRVRIDIPQANFLTPLDNQCGTCSDPETGTIGDWNNVTLCGGTCKS